MSVIFYSVRLFLYGYFCDVCVNLCTAYAEKSIINNRPLNKKLLIKMSNFSNNCLLKWQVMEKSYIKLCLERGFFWL